jgi:hypothetical protein
MSFIRLPRLQMVARGQQIKSCLARDLTKLHQFGYWKLFVGQHEPHHPGVLKTGTTPAHFHERTARAGNGWGERRA